MSDTTTGSGSADPGAIIRPLSVRMTESTRAQLDIIAQLNDRTVTEEVRHAIESWIEHSKSDPKVLERATVVKAEIEREAATKRGAIAAIFEPPARSQRPTAPASSTRPAKDAPAE